MFLALRPRFSFSLVFVLVQFVALSIFSLDTSDARFTLHCPVASSLCFVIPYASHRHRLPARQSLRILHPLRDRPSNARCQSPSAVHPPRTALVIRIAPYRTPPVARDTSIPHATYHHYHSHRHRITTSPSSDAYSTPHPTMDVSYRLSPARCCIDVVD